MYQLSRVMVDRAPFTLKRRQKRSSMWRHVVGLLLLVALGSKVSSPCSMPTETG